MDPRAESTERSENTQLRVVVRGRPLLSTEKQREDASCCRFLPTGAKEMQIVTLDPSTNRETIRSFHFDLCASEHTSQIEFFQRCGVVEILQSVVQGYLGTVFAYGQTGSGKTYSMSGLDELLDGVYRARTSSSSTEEMQDTDGILLRSIRYLYSLMQKASDEAEGEEVTFDLRASSLEIYNEHVYDLLNTSKRRRLSVRWNEHRGFYVQDLLVVRCDSIDDVMAVVHEGHKNRRVGSHEMNNDSSRSHSMVTIYVDRITKSKDYSQVVTKNGKLTFVDLAGSERLKETKSVNTDETCSINKSLLTLGTVISAASTASSATYIPYRDSKLTKLLMDSLGGSSFTLMIACISPSSEYLEETLSTLHYATRARNIKNKPTVQVNAADILVMNLQRQNAQLRAEKQALELRLGLLSKQQPDRLLHTIETRPAISGQEDKPNSSFSEIKLPLLSSSKQFISHEHSNTEQKSELQRLQIAYDQLLCDHAALNAKVLVLEDRIRHLAKFEPSCSVNTTPENASGSQSNAIEYLKRQVRQLQQREQDLMQALVRLRAPRSRICSFLPAQRLVVVEVVRR
uniref:Kinesin-like protein n=1 Tax=Albugo laibachii Nc14 TaxID=890382 RepID=F0WCZ6_9STRA|nr:kinesinlike protein putative [Albugo laibachii Nc14]|eukprot:CCA19067.1 kinesinlike protein putative [Albugo laibachii Nc14]